MIKEKMDFCKYKIQIFCRKCGEEVLFVFFKFMFISRLIGIIKLKIKFISIMR